jgi:STE24 endopeptidase
MPLASVRRLATMTLATTFTLAATLMLAAPSAAQVTADSTAAESAGARVQADSAAIAGTDSVAAAADTAASAPHDYIAEVRAGYNAENHAYFQRRVWLSIIEPLWTIAVGLVILFGGWAARMRDICRQLGKHRYVHVLVYLTLYSALAWVLTFPLSWYSGFALEHQFGLSTQNFAGWLADELKGQAVLIAFVGVLPLLALAYRAMEKSPRRWWLWFALATLPIVLFFTLIQPVVIDPIFNRFTPLSDETLKTEIVDLAKKAGIPGRNVYEVDQSTRTTTYNAYVNGFGASQRIVLWDTTLKGMTRDEILFVMGHEMGHYVLGHVWKGIVALALASFLLFWLASRMLNGLLGVFGQRWGIESLHDVASMPLLALTLSLISFGVQPIECAVSRMTEHEADLFGLEVTHLNYAGAGAFIKLASQNRANPEPPTWLVFWEYTHPPLLERVRTALDYPPWTNGHPNRFFHPGRVEPTP